MTDLFSDKLRYLQQNISFHLMCVLNFWFSLYISSSVSNQLSSFQCGQFLILILCELFYISYNFSWSFSLSASLCDDVFLHVSADTFPCCSCSGRPSCPENIWSRGHSLSWPRRGRSSRHPPGSCDICPRDTRSPPPQSCTAPPRACSSHYSQCSFIPYQSKYFTCDVYIASNA